MAQFLKKKVEQTLQQRMYMVSKYMKICIIIRQAQIKTTMGHHCESIRHD